MTEHLTLYELNSLVHDVVERFLPKALWVEAEISEANERRGHLFLELIEKDADDLTPKARAQAKCWASQWEYLKRHFESVTRQKLSAGMKVLLKVSPNFHTAYGFSWIITGIDPTFTLGDMARRRLEIIAQLKSEGVFDMQRHLSLPLFCQHIAVISSESAAGYGDFCRQLHDNEQGYAFETTLFPAYMQGEKVAESIIAALDSIYTTGSRYDCVVIIRGGGATSDLAAFDNLALAENVANFPLPVITGIGHDRDECILDMISHVRVKTPTAAAAYLISNLDDVAKRIDTMADRAAKTAARRIECERLRIETLHNRIPVIFALVKHRESNKIDRIARRMESAMRQTTQGERHRIEMLSKRLVTAMGQKTERERHRLSLLTQRTASLDPQQILQRGYSMTLVRGKIVSDASLVADGEIMETRLAKGTVTSRKI